MSPLVTLPGRWYYFRHPISKPLDVVEASLDLDPEEQAAVIQASTLPRWMEDVTLSPRDTGQVLRVFHSAALVGVASRRLEARDLRAAAETCVKALKIMDTHYVSLTLAEILANYGDTANAGKYLEKAKARFDFDSAYGDDRLENPVDRIQRIIDSNNRSPVELVVGSVHGGVAFLLDPIGRSIIGLQHLHNKAKDLGAEVSDGAAQWWQRAAEELGQRDAFDHAPRYALKLDKGVEEVGGSGLRFSERLVKVKTHPKGNPIIVPRLLKHLRHVVPDKDLMRVAEGYMRDYDMVLDQVHFKDWDKYYEFASDGVHTAAAFSHHIVAELEDLMNRATAEKGFDLSKFMDSDQLTESYHPRMLRSRADVELGRAANQPHVVQSQPQFFMNRKHKNYWDALTAGEKYQNGFDTLGLYTQTVHQMVIEGQAMRSVAKLTLAQRRTS